MQLILNHYQFDYYLSRKKYKVDELLFFKILLTDLVGPTQTYMLGVYGFQNFEGL
jgi:ABC-type glycerol-3-phosphate transport system permease component